MAYSECPRFQPIRTQTSEYLAPNYYYVTDPPSTKKNFIPFLSQSSRETCMTNKVWTEAIYNAEKPRRIPGGSSLSNRAKRVTFDTAKEAQSPGPSNYDPAQLLEPLEPTRRPRRLYVCKVPFSTEAKGPSVPSRIDENGYANDQDGKLVKIPADVHDVSLGPAYYNVRKGYNETKDLYGGCRWSASKTPRKTIDILNDYPGPGSYDIGKKPKSCFHEETEQYREMARMFSYQPRDLDLLQKRVKHEDLPGPAAYNLQRPFAGSKTVNKYSAFSTSGERARKPLGDSPGPAEYNLKDTVRINRVSRLDGTFICKSPRFKDTPAVRNNVPGPAAYQSPLAQSGDKYLKYRKVPFNTMVPRMEPLEESDTPGPSDYDHSEVDGSCKIGGVSSIFKSRKPRFVYKLDKFQKANPATYNISADFNRMMNGKSFLKKTVAFMTKSQRRLFEVKDKDAGPHVAHEDMPFKGYVLPLTPRFSQVDNEVPGPGAYNMETELDLALFKSYKTFNIKLKESIQRTKIRLPPSKTRDEWNRQRRKRKLLKVFNRREIEISESWMDMKIS